jgi:hypothetical protein
MVYTRLFVLVAAFYEWANTEHGITPGCMGMDDLYKNIVEMLKRHKEDPGYTYARCVKHINDMSKVACYAPTPWLSKEMDMSFKDGIDEYINSALNDLGSRQRHMWDITTSENWYKLFLSNYLLDDDVACKFNV